MTLMFFTYRNLHIFGVMCTSKFAEITRNILWASFDSHLARFSLEIHTNAFRMFARTQDLHPLMIEDLSGYVWKNENESLETLTIIRLITKSALDFLTKYVNYAESIKALDKLTYSIFLLTDLNCCIREGRSQDFFSGGGGNLFKKFSKNMQKFF